MIGGIRVVLNVLEQGFGKEAWSIGWRVVQRFSQLEGDSIARQIGSDVDLQEESQEDGRWSPVVIAIAWESVETRGMPIFVGGFYEYMIWSRVHVGLGTRFIVIPHISSYASEIVLGAASTFAIHISRHVSRWELGTAWQWPLDEMGWLWRWSTTSSHDIDEGVVPGPYPVT